MTDDLEQYEGLQEKIKFYPPEIKIKRLETAIRELIAMVRVAREQPYSVDTHDTCLASLNAATQKATEYRKRAVDAERERDEAQRNYLNTKTWWNNERELARKLDGDVAGMRTEIDELTQRAEAAEAAERELAELKRKMRAEPDEELIKRLRILNLRKMWHALVIYLLEGK